MNEQQLAAIWLQIFTAALASPHAPQDRAAIDDLVDWAAKIADAGSVAFKHRVEAKKP